MLTITAISPRAVTAACLSLAFAGLAPNPAKADSGANYVKLRAHSGWNRNLTYAAVQQNSAAYAGKVMELRGEVGGVAWSGGSVTAMLILDGGLAVNLAMPKVEASALEEYVNPRVRVLARVGDNSSGNVVPLTVLSIAHESEVAAIEAREAAREAAAAARRRRSRVAWRMEPYRGVARSPASGERLFDPGIPPQIVGTYQPYLGPRVRFMFPAYCRFICECNPRLSPDEAGRMACDLLRFSDQLNIDPRLVVAVIMAESHFNPYARSYKGAMGLGQLMPGTARELGVGDPFDPEQNLAGTVSYLVTRLNTFGGGFTFDQVCLALAAYNAGVGAVRKYRGIPPYRQTQAYVRRVMSYYTQLCGRR